MHIERMHKMIECLCEKAWSKMENGLECVDTAEMGQVVDMIKDLNDAEYKAVITKAMQKAEKEDEEERLIDKFKYIFKSKKIDSNNLNTFDCYTKLLNFYNDNDLSKYRNMIAHGKKDDNI